MAVNAEDVRPTRRWKGSPFGSGWPGWLQVCREHRGRLAIGLAIFLLLFGWLTRERGFLVADYGVGYMLGIVSAACMLVLLLYPLRKRYRILKFIGPLPKWFRNHMVLGVAAPIAALYHCSFQLGSLNSRIALFSALLVAGSGLVGRFIYAKIHRGLYGRKANLKELLARVKLTQPGIGTLGLFVPELMKRIAVFDREVLVPPKGTLDSLTLPLVLAFKIRRQRIRLMRFTRQTLLFQADSSEVVAEHRAQLEQTVRQYVTEHLRHVHRVAEFTAYERIFSLWHKVHFPFFVTLVVTVVLHVLVVHLY